MACGCQDDGCGGGVSATPKSTFNRPGLSALSYRIGDHGAFLQAMKDRLSAIRFENADGTSSAPLAGLTARGTGDFSIALLDAWATASDVLTFYQERIAQEGYLGTATERRSVMELARLIGYEPRPGVAASVFLAYTLDPNQVDPVPIAAGARSQSIPGPDELPQSFETGEDFTARREWNDLGVRTRRPQTVAYKDALTTDRMVFDGGDLRLRVGDRLLLKFGSGTDRVALRRIATVNADFSAKRTTVTLQPIAPGVLSELDRLNQDLAKGGAGAAVKIEAEIAKLYLGNFSPVRAVAVSPPPPSATSGPSDFVSALLKGRSVQPANGAALRRTVEGSFRPDSDAGAKLLVDVAPALAASFYKAWAGANLLNPKPELSGVFVFRTEASLFGASVPEKASYNKDSAAVQFTEWTARSDDVDGRAINLDGAYDAIVAGSFALLERSPYEISVLAVEGPGEVSTKAGQSMLVAVEDARVVQRSAYGTTGKATRLSADVGTLIQTMGDLRATLVHAQTEPLTLVDEPIDDPVDGDTIELGALLDGIDSGRWIALSGERADIPGVTGVSTSELLMVAAVVQTSDPDAPGGDIHSVLQLATPTAYSYRRETVKVNANVVKATHGETKMETLGSGDGKRSLLAFALKQPPVTYVSAPTPSGIASTLTVRVDGLAWKEVDSLDLLGPTDRGFVTQTDDDGKVSVIFGTGEHGARPATGVENVQAVYRSGIGPAGNVRAGQISLLATRPLGVNGVANPLPASGGAGREELDAIRDNAPLAVTALDRLVSLSDYATFARTFGGVGKAAAVRVSDGERDIVLVTLAGVDDAPIDETSDLVQNLLAAFRRFGDADLPVVAAPRERLTLVLSANVKIDPDRQWADVSTAVRVAVLAEFGFGKRSLGQPVFLSEVVGTMQRVLGVVAVDVDRFGAIPERRDDDGVRRLLTLDEISAAALAVGSGQFGPCRTRKGAKAGHCMPSVVPTPAGFSAGGPRPAQIALFSDALPETLILNPMP